MIDPKSACGRLGSNKNFAEASTNWAVPPVPMQIVGLSGVPPMKTVSQVYETIIAVFEVKKEILTTRATRCTFSVRRFII